MKFQIFKIIVCAEFGGGQLQDQVALSSGPESQSE